MTNPLTAKRQFPEKKGTFLFLAAWLRAACHWLPMKVPGFCRMPNHFTWFCGRTSEDGDPSRWMRRLFIAKPAGAKSTTHNHLKPATSGRGFSRHTPSNGRASAGDAA